MTKSKTTTDQKIFEGMIKVLIELGTEDYEQWPVVLINALFAYEMWKDGAEWDYVTAIIYDAHPNKESLINQLQNTFGYPKEKP